MILILIAAISIVILLALVLVGQRKQGAICMHRNEPTLTVIAQFKNEAMVLREFVEHYLWQGATRLLLTDNGSDDAWEETISDFIDAGVVRVFSDARDHQQFEILRDMFARVDTEWVLPVDLDEYVYARPPFANIVDFLKSTDADRIKIKWKFFTSNGHIRQPPSIRKGFTTMRAFKVRRSTNSVSTHKEHRIKAQAKNICRVANVAEIRLHHPVMKPGSKLIKMRDTRPNGRNPLNLNHYSIMSREYFETVKMTRGDAAFHDNDNLRSWEYFHKYDVPGEKDDELARLVALKI